MPTASRPASPPGLPPCSRNNNSKLRLKIVPNADSAKALAQFDRRQADLAVLRTDAKVPSRARALAILEHDVLLLLLSPGKQKIKSLAELKKKKIAVLGDGDNGAAFVRNILEISDGSDAASRIQMAPPNSTFDRLFARAATARRSRLPTPPGSSRTRATNKMLGVACSR